MYPFVIPLTSQEKKWDMAQFETSLSHPKANNALCVVVVSINGRGRGQGVLQTLS